MRAARTTASRAERPLSYSPISEPKQNLSDSVSQADLVRVCSGRLFPIRV